MKKQYLTEKEGQLDFFQQYSINFENNYGEEIIKDSTDGIFRGSLFEFKLIISDINKVLFQAIKYLSKERVKGHNVPASIFLISLNDNTAFEFKSKDYFKEIHTIYNGGASLNNSGFYAKTKPIVYDLEKLDNKKRFLAALDSNTDFLKINIDENCIVGWAERYYNENPNATKDDFLKEDGELRKPLKFKDFINPYTGETNERFKYIMDKLNDKMKKKTLGAFYTPIEYSTKVAELVRRAIKDVPEGNDYVIIDRCAGTGNLENSLTDDELSHCILSTFEYYEWLVLKERFGDRVKKILPDGEPTFNNGLITENNAMSKEFVENSYIQEILKNKNITVILLENPPYSEVVSNKGADRCKDTNSFILTEMKKEVSGSVTNEMANRFIWSAFKFYLRQPTDSLILLSPIKYWKNNMMIQKEFDTGYILNRKHFHATPAAVSCFRWKNKLSDINELKDIEILDLNNGIIEKSGTLDIRRCYLSYSDTFYDTRKDKTDKKGTVFCGTEGTERVDLTEKQKRCKAIFNKNIIAYLNVTSFMSDSKHYNLVRTNYFNANGFHVRRDNYILKTPLICGKLFYANSNNWWDDIYYNTSDGGTKYESDHEFLKSCLIYTGLSQHNKCLSFKGSDSRDYFNELCFDNISTHKPQALKDLEFITGKDKTITTDLCDVLVKTDENGNKIPAFKKYLPLNADEKELFKIWKSILDDAKQTKNYNKDYSYGLYQIIQELNTFVKTKDGNQYDYPSLNGNINTLKTKLKEYYKKYIEPKCFKYELLK